MKSTVTFPTVYSIRRPHTSCLAPKPALAPHAHVRLPAAVMSITVLTMSLIVERLWVVLPPSPYLDNVSVVLVTTGLMLFGGLIAFAMVVVEFTVIAETSALTFMVAGTFKEFVTGGRSAHALFRRPARLCICTPEFLLPSWGHEVARPSRLSCIPCCTHLTLCSPAPMHCCADLSHQHPCQPPSSLHGRAHTPPSSPVLPAYAVMAAVMFLGEDFSFINGIGLVVLICGVAVFNLTKYHKHIAAVAEGSVRTPRASAIDHHRRTSSDAMELLEAGREHAGKPGALVSPSAPAGLRDPSLLLLPTASISGPASHRRDLPPPAL